VLRSLEIVTVDAVSPRLTSADVIFVQRVRSTWTIQRPEIRRAPRVPERAGSWIRQLRRFHHCLSFPPTQRRVSISDQQTDTPCFWHSHKGSEFGRWYGVSIHPVATTRPLVDPSLSKFLTW